MNGTFATRHPDAVAQPAADPVVELYCKIAAGEAKLFDPELSEEDRELIELQLEGMRRDLEVLLDIPTVILLMRPLEANYGTANG